MFSTDPELQKDASNSSGDNSMCKEEDVYANVPTERALQFSIILQEINRKYSTTQGFKPS